MGEVTPSQRTPALSTAGSCRHCDPHTLCRVVEVPLSWTLVICPCCPLCTEAMDRAAPPPRAAGPGAVQSVGAEQRLAQSRAHPGQGRARTVPRASARSDGWAAMATLPAAASVTKGHKLLIGRLPDSHVVGWPLGCPLQQIIWASVGEKGVRVMWEQPLGQGGTAAAVQCSGL